MEERLRLAYLAAMDIPVWLLRAADPAQLEDEHVQPVPVATPAGHRARDLLDNSAPPRIAPPRAVTERARSVPQGPAEQSACALLLVPAGYTLFVDQAPPRGSERRVLELIAALSVAIGGERAALQPHPFAWPPRGVAHDRAQARDAVFGMMAKLRETRRFEQVIVMGEQAAALLLGWTGEQYRAREPRSQRVPGIDTPLLVTHSAAELLENPLLKRASWAEIQAGRSGDA